jgi:hypothetical protein
MTDEEFTKKLKELKLTKTKFAELTGCGYSTILGWGDNSPFPKWVASWLHYYELAQKYLDIREKIQ